MKILALASTLLLLAQIPTEPSTENRPHVLEILHRATERDRALRARRMLYQFDMKMVKEQLTRDNRLIDRKEIEKTVLSSSVIRYETRIEVDAWESEQSKSGEHIQRSENVVAEFRLEDMLPRFNYRFDRDQSVRGIPCYVVIFEPKREFENAGDREQKILNALRGRLWIEKYSFSIVKAEGKLSRHVPVAWIFATMRDLQFVYEAASLPNGDLGPDYFDLLFDLQISWTYVRERQKSYMRNYRLIEQAQRPTQR